MRLARSIALAALVIAPAIAARAQAAPPTTPPGTDIFLASLTERAGQIRIGTPVNITHRDGYDNQPSFTPDGRSILYTVRADSQSDIWRYDIAAKKSSQVTHTPESEYSATVMPGGRTFSVIRVERDSTQRLWKFAMNGGSPALVLEQIKPVGYHAWVDDSTLVLFVLGRPSMLQRANARTGEAKVVAHNIGRALLKMPGKHAVSFVQNDSAAGARIMMLDLRSGAVTPVAPLPEANEYHAWTKGGALLATQRGTVLRWSPSAKSWSAIATFTDPTLGKLSRIAISPAGDRIALVAEQPK
ncbi:MAG: hypothetical protein M3081_12320 [Gemmatimonadota bacterium]|nr:hypothetical protein [Gemmatimonadota bacterium]